jgi:hypothetical protein
MKFYKIAALTKLKAYNLFEKIIVINTTILYVCVTIVNHEVYYWCRKISLFINTISVAQIRSGKAASVIGDLSLALAEKKTSGHPNATAIALDILIKVKEARRSTNIVISMLPAHLHIEVAEIVWFIKEFGNGLVHKRLCKSLMLLQENNLVFMNEIGLDPELIT